MHELESRFASEERTALEAIGVMPYAASLAPVAAIEFVSSGLASLLGLSLETLAEDPRALLDLIDPALRARFDDTPEAVAGHLEGPLEFHITTVDGRELYLRQCGIVSRDEQGRPVRIEGVVRDVTPITQTLRALRESEISCDTLLESAPFGAFLHRSGEVISMNPAARRMLGIAEDAPLECLDIEGFIDLDDRGSTGQGREDSAGESPVPSKYEVTIHDASQQPRHFLIGAQGLVYEGLPTTLVSLVDISERKRAEEELDASRRRFQAIVEIVPEGLYVEREGVLLFANKACLQLLGVSSLEDIIGVGLHELMQELDETACHGSASHPDEQVKWSRLRALREKDSQRILERALMDGEFLGQRARFGILRDVTEQVSFQGQLEQRLAFESLMCQVSTQFINTESAEMDCAIQQALESLGDLAAVDRCYLTLITPDFYRVMNGYEWSREGIDPCCDILLGETTHDYPWAARCLVEDGLLHVPDVAAMPDEAEAEQALLERQGVQSTIALPLYSHGVWRGFFGLETVTRKQQWSDDEISTLRLAAQIFSYAINRKHAEEERDRIEVQMQTALKMESLGVLVGGVAHDFNNLLMGILGNASLALHEIPPEHPLHTAIAEIDLAAKHAAQLVRQMLAYAGRGTATKRPMELSALVGDIGHLLRTGVSKKSKFSFELIEPSPIVQADETQIRQIVMNLVTNAAQSLPDGEGSIVLRTGTRVLGPEDLGRSYLGADAGAGEFAFFEVQDTGCGMPPETIMRMFDPFFTSKPQGTGLGLASTLGTVRAHGGVIEVDSAPGRGTRITIYLPLATQAAASIQNLPSSATPPAGDTGGPAGVILVVDDEPGVRSVARRILERWNYTVIEASNGREGLERFQDSSLQWTAILLDMAMPEMDGAQAFAAMRDLGPVVPVIFSSGFLVREVVEQLLREPATAFIPKPYPPSRLIEVLNALIAAQAGTSPPGSDA